MLPFVREFAREGGDARLGHRVAAPVGTRVLAAVVQREHDGRVRRGIEQWHQRARQAHRGRDIDAQQRQPAVERLMFDGSERAQQRRRVDQPVEPADLRLQRALDIGEIGGLCPAKVEGQDDRLGVPRGDDVVVERLELAFDPRV